MNNLKCIYCGQLLTEKNYNGDISLKTKPHIAPFKNSDANIFMIYCSWCDKCVGTICLSDGRKVQADE